MKAIGPIHLICRDGKGSRRVPVGIVKNNATEGIRFKYNQEMFSKEVNHSFLPYEAFPDMSKEYKENVLDIFGQRLMRSERNDVNDFYKFWQLDTSKREDKYYMLAMTQGLLPTDNYEFLAEFNPKKGLVFVSEITGLSHSHVRTQDLHVGDHLDYQLEPDNEYDKYAVKVFKGGLFLGYIKTVHNRVFYKAKKLLKITVHALEGNETLSRAFIKIEV
jgi:hypothetical protein